MNISGKEIREIALKSKIEAAEELLKMMRDRLRGYPDDFTIDILRPIELAIGKYKAELDKLYNQEKLF